ncbi:lipoprotein-releasing ABC transporter ATP-binding protein LolD [Alcaligenaceae bacterium LF4-65]|jgi:lipoprotein-releasing system ATP-binding protein|uniref:Lipoprotein-releasing system ATP-binding protein LolD n=1 Tax=Zwartia hollandica TaxID=324606 RepID=A0A953T0N3_9BURK|nr:lipoprotein-releasing ABC transporter ATP-binding protein LolD [Zwartia hollandica]MBZ1349308.1 lipoprotein-releasing ABC transporter ATP-binding protein LolD [Zwartia hollandica]
MTDYALRAQNVCKHYAESGVRIDVLNQVNLSIVPGEMVAVVGASGSGKSTLLHILGLLDIPSSGSIEVAGQSSEGLSEAQRSRLRNRGLGFVYQFHHLLAEFTALDNVAMPRIVGRQDRDSARAEAQRFLEMVGLKDRVLHYPGQLSGGERQRVALARALVNQPACVLADEPTGNLDRHTAHRMFDLLKQVNADSKTAFLVVTHDAELAALADRRLLMDAGRLVDAT